MKNIGVIGFNIFAPGGTTRSNINLINEFSSHDYNMKVFNYRDFSDQDIEILRERENLASTVQFFNIKDIMTDTNVDLYIITRESFFVLSKIIKTVNPNAIVVGEVHAPMGLIKDDLTETLKYVDCVRVATESIKQEFMKKYNYNRVFSHTISLVHLKTLPKIEDKPTNNLLIYSRFDESQKDIAYSIKLMDYIVNYLGYKNIRLYINGYGIGETLYRNLVAYYNIQRHVIINGVLPESYIYFSTSKFETLGYSIIEAIASGHRALLYGGVDDVVAEIYKEFKTVNWLTKNVEQDGRTVVDFIEKAPTIENNEFDLQLIENMSKDYAPNFVKKIYSCMETHEPATKISLQNNQIEAIFKRINFNISNKPMTKLEKVYTLVKDTPILGTVLKKQRVKQGVKKILGFAKRGVPSTKAKNAPSSQKGPSNLNNKSYFIESFHGKNFSGDPKYIALDIKNAQPDAKIYVSSINQLVDIEIRQYGCIPLRLGSPEYVKRFSECKYVIVNGNTLDIVGKQPGQIFIQTWHGFPLKRMVNDLTNPMQREKESKAFAPRMQKWDYLLTSSKFNTELLDSAFRLSENPNLTVLDSGLPKNEFLIKNKDSKAIKDELHLKYFNRPNTEDKKYILFCPTWRKNARNNITQINLIDLLSYLPENYEIIVKLHPLESSLRNNYSYLDERIHCFFNELVDIQELYILSDVLISDYSSAVFDYVHTDGKIIILQEDSDEYVNTVGWYFDLNEVCGITGENYSTKELAEAILAPDDKVYNRNISSKLLTNDQIGSSKQILSEIFNLKK